MARDLSASGERNPNYRLTRPVVAQADKVTIYPFHKGSDPQDLPVWTFVT